MTISRRKFLRGIAAGGGGLLLASQVPPANAAMSTELPPQAVGLLYDATLCVGCKACMTSCKTENSVPGGALYSEGMKSPTYESTGAPDNAKIWDAPNALSGKTLNIIKVYKNGTAEKKDRAINGYSFFKQQCLHCIAPACVSVCPAAALKKNPENGVVYYVAHNCIGCRYCQLACPFGIPRYEWSKAWPEVRKCQLCQHRFKDNKISACAEVCPTGATIFGKVVDLRKEAQNRITQQAGSEYEFPLNKIGSKLTTRRPIAKYAEGVYGLTEAAGTQNLLLSGVSFELIGFRKNIPKTDLPSLTWAYIHKIPWVFAGVFIGGTALHAITNRLNKNKGEESHD